MKISDALADALVHVVKAGKAEGLSDAKLRELLRVAQAQAGGGPVWGPATTITDWVRHDLPLTTRAKKLYALLRKRGCATLGDVANFDRSQILRSRQIGRKTLKDLVTSMERAGCEIPLFGRGEGPVGVWSDSAPSAPLH